MLIFSDYMKTLRRRLKSCVFKLSSCFVEDLYLDTEHNDKEVCEEQSGVLQVNFLVEQINCDRTFSELVLF